VLPVVGIRAQGEAHVLLFGRACIDVAASWTRSRPDDSRWWMRRPVGCPRIWTHPVP